MRQTHEPLASVAQLSLDTLNGIRSVGDAEISLADPLLRPEEVARLLSVRPSWVYEKVRAGELPCLTRRAPFALHPRNDRTLARRQALTSSPGTPSRSYAAPARSAPTRPVGCPVDSQTLDKPSCLKCGSASRARKHGIAELNISYAIRNATRWIIPRRRPDDADRTSDQR